MNIKHLFLLLALAAFFCVELQAQRITGNGKLSSETRQLENFHSIRINGACDLYIARGNSGTLRLETDENILDHIKTTVKEGVLIIEEDDQVKKHSRMNVWLSINDLKKLDVYGACDIKTEDQLRCEQLKIGVYGAAEIDMDLDVEQLSIQISGAGEARLKGSAEQVSYHIDGAAEIEAVKLEAQQVKLNISGTGSAEVYAQERLDVDVSGMATVKYKGSPEIRKNISGMGKLSSL